MNERWRGCGRICRIADWLVLAAVPIVYAGLSWWLYAPPAGWTDGFILGSGVNADSQAFLWFLGWWPHALGQHISPFHTDLVDAPAGARLAWRANVSALGLLATSAIRAWGVVAVYNSLMLAAPALAAWGAWLAALELSRSRPAAFIAGLVFGFSSYEIGQITNHINMAFTAAVPLMVWACLRAARRGWSTAKLGCVLGGLLTFQFGVSQEIFASCCVFGAIAAVILWWTVPEVRVALRRLAPGVLAALAISAVLLSPILVEMIVQYGTGREHVAPASKLPNDLLSFILPVPTAWVGGRFLPWAVRMTGRADELVAYLGLPLILLLVAIYRARGAPRDERALCLVALVAAVASLGPFLNIGGIAVGTAPWIAVAYLPFVGAILPARLILYGWLAISLVLALWLSRAGPRPWRYAAVAAALVFVVPSPDYARQWMQAAVPDVVYDHAAIPARGRVVFLPDFDLSQSYQSMSGFAFRLVGQGYLGNGQPQPFARWVLYGPLSRDEFDGIDPRAFAAYLSTYSTERVVVLKEAFVRRLPAKFAHPAAAAAAERLMRATGWRLAVETPDALVFAPPSPMSAPAASPEQLAAWMDRARVDAEAKGVRIESDIVCKIGSVAGRLRLDPTPVQRLYAWIASSPRPIGEIVCAP